MRLLENAEEFVPSDLVQIVVLLPKIHPQNAALAVACHLGGAPLAASIQVLIVSWSVVCCAFAMFSSLSVGRCSLRVGVGMGTRARDATAAGVRR